MKETLPQMETINSLLEDRKKLDKELQDLVTELNEMAVEKSDSENRTEQLLNNEQNKKFIIFKISGLQTLIKGIDDNLNRIQGIKNKN
jgi:hypothetical protein